MYYMSPTRKVATFRLEDDLRAGLALVWKRDGILPSEQVRRAVRAWLESKDALTGSSGRPGAATVIGKRRKSK